MEEKYFNTKIKIINVKNVFVILKLIHKQTYKTKIYK